MRSARLTRIRRRCEAATPGPWELDEELADWDDRSYVQSATTQACVAKVYVPPRGDGVPSPRDGAGAGEGVANARFIAHAREDVPALLAEIDRLRRALAEARRGAAERRRR